VLARAGPCLYTRRVRRALLLLALVISVPSCSCNDERTRNEAMLFLDRYEDVDVDDPLEQRRAMIEDLRGLALSDEDVSRARNACVDAYTALIEAEDLHAAASAQVDVVSRSGGDPPPDIQAQIEHDIEGSGAAIERSRELLPTCTREVNALETRFHRRRH
jgi:hypothetical protein